MRYEMRGKILTNISHKWPEVLKSYANGYKCGEFQIPLLQIK
ncbi:MAG: hypothetical protein WC533_03255 [Candidatus Pacearchaeota archaeon]